MKLILTDATHTTILAGLIGFMIALSVLLAFVAWGEWSMMLRYHAHEFASRRKQIRDARKATRAISRQLARDGFAYCGRTPYGDRWEQKSESGVRQHPAPAASASVEPAPAPLGADAFISDAIR
jgi:hypothetical protein